MNASEFIQRFGVPRAEQIIASAPSWAEKFDTSINKYRRRVKQLSYMIHEVDLFELKVELRQIELGAKLSFKERLAVKRELEILLKGGA
ncbi:hypothetical protein [Acinetobacter baumannii]|uniref:hypothetical protein n=1 Tax=Acinetobacter baumannii TaxID=470 RepID=UPI003891C06D